MFSFEQFLRSSVPSSVELGQVPDAWFQPTRDQLQIELLERRFIIGRAVIFTKKNIILTQVHGVYMLLLDSWETLGG
jgi:hypothetical protein